MMRVEFVLCTCIPSIKYKLNVEDALVGPKSSFMTLVKAVYIKQGGQRVLAALARRR